MADNFNYRRGETNPVIMNVLTATGVSLGDLVEFDKTTNKIRSASAHTWNTNIATTQEEFHDIFAGVAMQRKTATVATPGHGGGKANEIRIATEGVFEFDCAAGDTFEPGDLVGPAKQTGNALENQKVVAVATANLAIGRVEERKTSTTLTKVKVAIKSTIQLGGPQAAI